MTKQLATAIRSLAFVAALGAFSSAQALSVSAQPEALSGFVGEQILVDLVLNFDEPTVGGSVDITVSGAGSFGDFTPSEFLNSLDPSFTSFGGPADGADGDFYVAPGDFAGFSGEQSLGTFTVNLDTEGLVSIALDFNSLLGGFFQANSPFGPQTVDLIGATIESTVVPVPAAVWLFGSALGLLAGVRRRLQTA